MSRGTIASCLFVLVIATGCRDREPTLVVHTSPPDAVVAVDGYIHPGGSPHSISFKGPGRYLLSVSRESFREVEMYVTMGPGARVAKTIELVTAGDSYTDPLPPVVSLPPVTPPDGPPPPVIFPDTDRPVDTFTLAVSSVPAGAQVLLREPGRPGSRDPGRTPLTLQLPRDRATEVTISLSGYEDHRRLVIAPTGVGSDAVNLSVNLSRAHRNPPGNGPIVQPPPPPPPPPPYNTSEDGYLSVNTNPWTSVHLDGRPLGNTPLVRVPVRPGAHEVLMENRDRGVRRKKSIRVSAGEHVRLVERLD